LVSVAIGALLVPLSAFGASSLLSALTEEPTPPSVNSTTTTVGATPTADLGVACGEEGMQLIAAEAAGSITDVQQAALDALRDICAAGGMPLPEPVAPAVAPTTASTIVAPATVTTSSGRGHDDRDDDDSGHDDDHDDDHGGHGGDRDDDDDQGEDD
jgi:hypothetical protein